MDNIYKYKQEKIQKLYLSIQMQKGKVRWEKMNDESKMKKILQAT